MKYREYGMSSVFIYSQFKFMDKYMLYRPWAILGVLNSILGQICDLLIMYTQVIKAEKNFNVTFGSIFEIFPFEKV